METVKGIPKQILHHLPGGDCKGLGKCGHATCAECAEAILGEQRPDMCPACSQYDVDFIASLLGVETVVVEPKVVYVKCGGSAAGKERFAGVSSCVEAKEKGFLPGECQYGCTGNGDCLKACVYGALSLEDGKVIVDHDKCNGCGACIDMCPQKLIGYVPEDATNFIPCSSLENENKTFETCGYGCIGCGDCALACPKGAIEMVIGHRIDGRYAKIDYSKCEGCVSCTAACRRKIIIDTIHDPAEIKDTVAFVKCVGGSWGSAKLRDAGYERCIDVERNKVGLDAMDVCKYSCIGLGDCVNVCRYGAITNEEGVAKVDTEKCVGCGDCYRECPKHKIEMVPYIGVKQSACESAAEFERRMQVCGLGCIGCGDCAENCPNEAIEMIYGHPYIHDDKCLNCGVCTYLCTRSSLIERIVPESNYIQRRALALDD